MRVAGIPLGVGQKTYQALYPEELFFDFDDDFLNKGSFETTVTDLSNPIVVPIFSDSIGVVSGKSILMQDKNLQLDNTDTLAVGNVSWECGFRIASDAGGDCSIFQCSEYVIYRYWSSLYVQRKPFDGTWTNLISIFSGAGMEHHDIKVIYDSTLTTIFVYKNNVLVNQTVMSLSKGASKFELIGFNAQHSHYLDNFYFKLL